LAAQPVEQVGFVDEELHLRDGSLLGFDRYRGEPGKPGCDLILLIRGFQLVVIRLTMSEDCRGQRD
jgi:hypothetical protein